MIVKLRRKNPRYPDLTPQQYYVVIGIEADALRILNDEGQPYLYPPRIFDIVEADEPNDWLPEYGEDNERYVYPPPLNGVSFFEDFFDEKRDAVVAFWQVVNQRLAMAKGVVRASRKKPLALPRFIAQANS